MHPLLMTFLMNVASGLTVLLLGAVILALFSGTLRAEWKQWRRNQIIATYYDRYDGDLKCYNDGCGNWARWLYTNDLGNHFYVCQRCVNEHMSRVRLFK